MGSLLRSFHGPKGPFFHQHRGSAQPGAAVPHGYGCARACGARKGSLLRSFHDPEGPFFHQGRAGLHSAGGAPPTPGIPKACLPAGPGAVPHGYDCAREPQARGRGSWGDDYRRPEPVRLLRWRSVPQGRALLHPVIRHFLSLRQHFFPDFLLDMKATNGKLGIRSRAKMLYGERSLTNEQLATSH